MGAKPRDGCLGTPIISADCHAGPVLAGVEAKDKSLSCEVKDVTKEPSSIVVDEEKELRGTTMRRHRHGKHDLDRVPSSNPLDPLNWPRWKKDLNICMVAFHAMMTTFTATAIVPAAFDFVDAYGIPASKTPFLTSSQILAMGLFPIMWAPVAARYGRIPVFLVSTFGAMCCNIGGCFARTFPQQLATRILNTMFICPPITLGAAIVHETTFRHERATRLGFWTLLTTLGAPLGPFIFGFVAQRVQWQWIFASFAITNFVQFLGYVFFSSETLGWRETPGSKPPASAVKAPDSSPEAQDQPQPSPSSSDSDSTAVGRSRSSSRPPSPSRSRSSSTLRNSSENHRRSTDRTDGSQDIPNVYARNLSVSNQADPFFSQDQPHPPNQGPAPHLAPGSVPVSKLPWGKAYIFANFHVTRIDPTPFSFRAFTNFLTLAAIPAIIFPTIAHALSFGYTNVAMIVMMPHAIGDKFDLDPQAVGLQYAAIIIGSLIGESIAGPLSDWWLGCYRDKTGAAIPSRRLWLFYPGCLCVFAGLLTWGFQLHTVRQGHYDITPAIGAGIAAFGSQVLSTTLITFAVDNRPARSSEVGLFVNMVRQTWAFLGPFYLPPLFDALGYGFTAGLQCALIFVGGMIPVAILHFFMRHRTTGEPSGSDEEDGGDGDDD